MVDENNIFDNQDEVVENIEESAEAMGIDKESVSIKPRKIYVARNNCKACHGHGVQRIMPPGSKTFKRYPCKCVRVKVL